MKFHIVTIFPEFFRGPFEHGVIQKAREAGLIEIHVHDLRTWTYDRHRTVDDRPFGGGEGMLLKAGPIFEAVEAIWPERSEGSKVVLLSASTEIAPKPSVSTPARSRPSPAVCACRPMAANTRPVSIMVPSVR